MIDAEILKVFCNTFVLYYRAHQAHWNTRGRWFMSDHKVLQKIYEDLFQSVDDIAEIIRTLDIELPQTLTEIIEGSDITDMYVMDDGEGDQYLEAVYLGEKMLVDSFRELEQVTNTTEYSHINNFAQDRVRILEKSTWILRSILSERFDNLPY